MAIAEHLEHIRQRIRECGVSAPRLAKAADLSNKTLRHYRLASWNPTAETLIKIEAALDDLNRGHGFSVSPTAGEIKFPKGEGRRRSPSGTHSGEEAA